ncbi:hypothetical protein DSO57_1037193 [Entomophthora muscae]|uniref:Uncharacterized protein n=1 Tax=Entomophthora muscae TaxID=34485 RepID=A0ACC2RDV1_9FUNG|nr:hypothetical protein DSO57_1037193 [Entomophthora muscae]
MSLTSEELNLLIFHYLQESGFSHSAFVFQEEILRKCEVPDIKISKGALVSVVQKGLQYMEVEAHINENGEELQCSAPFTLLGEHKCELQVLVDDLEDFSRPHKIAKISENPMLEQPKLNALPPSAIPEEVAPVLKVQEDLQIEVSTTIPEPETPTTVEIEATIEDEQIKSHLTQDARDRSYKVVIEEDATILLGHESEVNQHSAFANDPLGLPVYLESCFLFSYCNGSSKPEKISSHYMCNNSTGQNRDIAAMDWHPKGVVLATGSYDGYVRQFTSSGWLRFQGDEHSTPVLSVKYSPRGSLLLSGGMDMTARIWCTTTGRQLHQLTWHTDAVVDVDWESEDIFATCSNDGLICVGLLSQADPFRVFSEHSGPVNSIRWSPKGNLLASCSDDKTIKLWSTDKVTSLKTLKGHEATISTIRWSPGATGPNSTHILATASDDKTVCLWDVSTGTLLYRLAQHTLRVSSITFSPDSKYLASSAFDSAIHVFSTESGEVVKSFFRQGEIFAVEWSPCGQSLAACFADSSVAVFDLSK